MNEQDWTIPTDAHQYLLRQQKTLGMEQRRRGLTKAEDVLGPALGPYAVQIDNLNGDVGAFNGMWVAAPGTLGSPSIDKWVAGYTIASQANGGYQYASLYLPTDAPHTAWERGWTVIPGSGGMRAYSDWAEAGGATPPAIPDTGWVDVAYQSGFSGTTVGQLQVRRRDMTVQLRGGGYRTAGVFATGTRYVCAILPATVGGLAVRPLQNVKAGSTGTSTRPTAVQLDPDGSLYISKSDAVSGNVQWSDCGMTYLMDS